MRGTFGRRAKGVKWINAPICILILGLLMAPFTAAADEEPAFKPAYRLGIFPYLPALTIDRLYGPLAESMSLQLDRLVRLRTKSTFENFEDAIASESYDILFVHPFFYVDAVDDYGYLPLARLDQQLNAVLVTAENSGARALAHLQGETIGLPPRLAAVSKLIKSALVDEGLRPGLDVGIRHFRNKVSCLQATNVGAVAACGVPAFILAEPDVIEYRPLQIIYEAPPVSHFAFAVHNRVPAEERSLLQQLILSLGEDNVDGFGAKERFVLIDEQDYAGIRETTSNLKTLAQR
jgi:ABC-type phosphate/phosphonate transport system substrate-binding protein